MSILVLVLFLALLTAIFAGYRGWLTPAARPSFGGGTPARNRRNNTNNGPRSGWDYRGLVGGMVGWIGFIASQLIICYSLYNYGNGDYVFMFFGFAFPCAGAILAGYMARDRNGNEGRSEAWNKLAMIQATFLSVVWYWPVANAWWQFSYWGVITIVTWILLLIPWVLFPSRYTLPAGLFWGLVTGVGGWIARWGFYWSFELTNSYATAGYPSADWHPTQEILRVLLVGMSVILTTAFEVFWIVWVSFEGGRNRVLFDLRVPGTVKWIQTGTTVNLAVGDLTGVPMPKEPLPFRLLSASYEQIWNWMVGFNNQGKLELGPNGEFLLERRGDPRPFLSNYLMIAPAVFFPTIPWFGYVAYLFEMMLGTLGRIVGTLQEMSDQDYTKGPFSTAGGPEVIVKVGFGLRLINVFRIWFSISWKAYIDHAVDVYTAGLVKAIGVDLYGEMGNPRLLDQPGRQSQGTPLYSPAVQYTRPGSQGVYVELGERDEIPDAALKVAGLTLAFQLSIALRTGMLVTDVRLKDVDLEGDVTDIRIENIKLQAAKTMAKAKGEAVREIAMAHVNALMDKAVELGLDEKKIGEILMEASDKYFLQGLGAEGAVLGVLAGR